MVASFDYSSALNGYESHSGEVSQEFSQKITSEHPGNTGF